MKHVLVVGDSILDVYRDCSFKKECPDAPGVPAVIQNSIEDRPGGAANVAANLLSLSPDTVVELIGVVGGRVERSLRGFGWGDRLVLPVTFGDQLSIVKERTVVDGRTVVRVDSLKEVAQDQAAVVFSLVQEALRHRIPDLIILSDYGAGTVNKQCLDLLLEHRDILLIDTKEPDLSTFRSPEKRSLLVKLNEAEWCAALRRYHSPEEFFDFLVVTRGSAGAFLYIHRESGVGSSASCTRVFSVHGLDVPQVDVCGCGDTFMAGLAACMLTGRDMFDSLRFANCAAASVVSRPRTCVADRSTVIDMFGKEI